MKRNIRWVATIVAAAACVGGGALIAHRSMQRPADSRCVPTTDDPRFPPHTVDAEALGRAELVVFATFTPTKKSLGRLDVVEVLKGPEQPRPLTVSFRCDHYGEMPAARGVFIVELTGFDAHLVDMRYQQWVTPRRVKRVLAGDRAAAVMGETTWSHDEWLPAVSRAACVIEGRVNAEPDGLGNLSSITQVVAHNGSCPQQGDRFLVPEDADWDLGRYEWDSTFALQPGRTPGTWIVQHEGFVDCVPHSPKGMCDKRASTV
jgi:hypothetical protein